MNNHRIILPGEMKIKPSPNQTMMEIPQPPLQRGYEVQVQIFPIPVRSNESFLMYALCLYAIETGKYADMPEIAPQLQAMKDGLEASYQKLALPPYEYRKFVTQTQPATTIEEICRRAQITWETLSGIVIQEETKEREYVEMGTQEEEAK